MIGFGQSGFTVVAPVPSERVASLRALLDRIGENPEANEVMPFKGIPGLHYASLVLFPLGEECRLLFEGNIDGTAAEFLTDLGSRRAEGLDAVLGHCAGFQPGRAAEYLRSHDVGYGCFYVGCPGRRAEQIAQESCLRAAIEPALGADGRGTDRAGIQALVRQSPDLAFTQRPYVRPWLVRYGPLAVKVAEAVLGIALVGLLAWGFVRSPFATLAGIVGLAIVGLGAWAYLRHLESTDKPDPNLKYKDLSDVLDREDFGIGNHLASVTAIKPGLFRAVLLRGVLLFVGFAARFLENQGQLAGIPTIHFARWVIVERRTLVFLSNFDGSWESYLNDFIDKGAAGLTAVWSNTVGFPRTVGLTGEGARDERGFKTFARNSQVPTLVWYRAYPDLSTANVENDTRIREGLFADTLGKEKERWIKRF